MSPRSINSNMGLDAQAMVDGMAMAANQVKK